tara:strand:+ start:2012 stop:2674 length:663 start_codon:yes stop_codon:yes gene_type:complete
MTLSKSDIALWNKCINNFKSWNQKKSIDFLNKVSKNNYTDEEYFELSKHFDMDILIFKKLHYLSYLEQEEQNRILSFSKGFDVVIGLLQLSNIERGKVINKFSKKGQFNEKKESELLFKEIDRIKKKKSNNLTPQGVSAQDVLMKCWPLLAETARIWIPKLSEADIKRIKNIKRTSKDKDWNWLGETCINAIRKGQIRSKRNSGEFYMDIIYNCMKEHLN